jgi:hypothetical protein
LIGLAAGARLTFAPTVAAFALAMFLAPGKSRAERLIGIALLTGAAALALMPSWWLLAIAPRQFFFGNFTYPALNTLYRRQEGFTRSMTAFGKFAYVFKDLCNRPGNLLIFGSAVAFLFTLRRKPGQPDHPRRFELLSLALLIGTLLIGSFAPTPLWTPYFFAPMTFAALFVACGLADTRKTVAQALPLWRFLAACTLICAGIGVLQYREVFAMRRPADWTPMQVHAMGKEIADRCGHGPVLTYAPLAPLEGGCTIYPEFATGPFAARVARWVPEDEEKVLKAVDPDDLQEMLLTRPPGAILLGYEQSLEKPLRAVANAGGFKQAPPFAGVGAAARDKELWVPTSTSGK